MDTAQWAQGIGVIKPMEANSKPSMLERRARPQKDQALNCPRCNSTNTKFCYYNNYSLSQPRYFCKTCRRYWTEGGSLRNVPVGGGSRKNKRSSSSSSTSSPTTVPLPASAVKKLPVDLTTPTNFPNQSANSQNPPKIQYQGQDLNLAYPPSDQDYNNSISKFIENPYNHNPSSSSQLSAMEILKTGISSSKGLNSLFPMSVTSSDSGNIYNSAGFANLQEFKPTTAGLNFNLEGLENGYGGISGIQEGSAGARMLFPIEDLKQVPSNNTSEFDHQQNRSQGDHHNNHSTGYWTGMLGGGSW